MNLLGFNITRSKPAPAAKSIGDLAGGSWLRGDDGDHIGSSLSNAYQQVVWVYRAINTLAEQVSNIPFLFSNGERGRENLITGGPLYDFYKRPHKHLNRFQYWELRVIWLMLRGECFRLPIYSDQVGTTSTSSPNKSKLQNVVFLDPAQMLHIVEDHELVGWRYMSASRFSPVDSQIFLPEEIWHERLPNPFDFWRGMPPLHVADMAARTDFAASSYMRELMDNNAETGLIVRSDNQLDDDQREQVMAAIRNRKRRAGTSDRPMLLWGVNEIVQPTLSSADLQFLENRKFSRSEICTAFGVPEEIITATEHAKYDVMHGARQNFIENRISPLCNRLAAEEDATVKSIDPRAVGWFDVDSLPIMQEARRNRLQIAKTGFQMGIPLNELNRVFDLGFKSFPWGETGYVPSNSVPVGSLNKT